MFDVPYPLKLKGTQKSENKIDSTLIVFFVLQLKYTQIVAGI